VNFKVKKKNYGIRRKKIFIPSLYAILASFCIIYIEKKSNANLVI
jgi:hypothetical protein